MQYNNIKTIFLNAVTTGDDTDYFLFYDFYKYIYDIDILYFIAEKEIVYGTNVMILSDDSIKTESNIRAINFNRNFNSGLNPQSTDIKILKADDIIQGTYDKPYYRELENANWFNFRHREDYGRLNVVDINCNYYNDIVSIIDGCVDLFVTDYIFIDIPLTDDDIAAIDKYIGGKSQIQCMVNVEKLQ